MYYAYREYIINIIIEEIVKHVVPTFIIIELISVYTYIIILTSYSDKKKSKS